MNAAEQARSVELAAAIATTVGLFRQRFPDARPNLAPWRDDDQTRRFAEGSSVDIAFHLPGWSPRWQCRSVLVQLRLAEPLPMRPVAGRPRLVGVLISGLTFQGEQWRLATVGSWAVTGRRPPAEAIAAELQHFCRELLAGLQCRAGDPAA